MSVFRTCRNQGLVAEDVLGTSCVATYLVGLGDLVDNVLVIGPKFSGFKPGREQYIFKDDRISITTSFAGEVKPSTQFRMLKTHAEYERYFVDKINRHFTPRFF